MKSESPLTRNANRADTQAATAGITATSQHMYSVRSTHARKKQGPKDAGTGKKELRRQSIEEYVAEAIHRNRKTEEGARK